MEGFFVLAILVISANLLAQVRYANDSIVIGAERTELYIPRVQGKRVALVANQTSMVRNTPL